MTKIYTATLPRVGIYTIRNATTLSAVRSGAPLGESSFKLTTSGINLGERLRSGDRGLERSHPDVTLGLAAIMGGAHYGIIGGVFLLDRLMWQVRGMAEPNLQRRAYNVQEQVPR